MTFARLLPFFLLVRFFDVVFGAGVRHLDCRVIVAVQTGKELNRSASQQIIGTNVLQARNGTGWRE